MKKFFAFIVCLVLFMAHQAFSVDGHENGREVDRIQRQHYNQANMRENTAICPISCSKLLPWNWSWATAPKVTLIMGLCVILLYDYLVKVMERHKCPPAIYCDGFDGSGFINCTFPRRNEVYKSDAQILLNFTNATLNNTHLECGYARFNRHPCPPYQSYSEIYGASDAFFNLPLYVSPKYYAWNNYVMRYLPMAFISMYLIVDVVAYFT